MASMSPFAIFVNVSFSEAAEEEGVAMATVGRAIYRVRGGVEAEGRRRRDE
jgi:hypothetical protein